MRGSSGAVAVFNAGSSSIRFAVFAAAASGAEPTPVWRGRSEGVGHRRRFVVADAAGRTLTDEATEDHGREFEHAEALERILTWLDAAARESGVVLTAAGHRVVHGGREFPGPALVTPDVVARLGALEPLAPLHQPHNVAAIRTLAAIRPGLPQVACFDTSFHLAQPPLARLIALPAEVRERGVERYGFHGLSYEHIARRLPAHLGSAAAAGRVVIAHLGNGASL
jgi:acetate kinase